MKPCPYCGLEDDCDPITARFPPFDEGDILFCEDCGGMEIATGVLWEPESRRKMMSTTCCRSSPSFAARPRSISGTSSSNGSRRHTHSRDLAGSPIPRTNDGANVVVARRSQRRGPGITSARC